MVVHDIGQAVNHHKMTGLINKSGISGVKPSPFQQLKSFLRLFKISGRS